MKNRPPLSYQIEIIIQSARYDLDKFSLSDPFDPGFESRL